MSILEVSSTLINRNTVLGSIVVVNVEGIEFDCEVLYFCNANGVTTVVLDKLDIGVRDEC